MTLACHPRTTTGSSPNSRWVEERVPDRAHGGLIWAAHVASRRAWSATDQGKDVAPMFTPLAALMAKSRHGCYGEQVPVEP